MKLSVFIITLNEEQNLERCLKSVNWADEIVVVDSGSTDRTMEIARRFTDKVITRRFDDFSSQKAAAMAAATNDWVLNLDADEVVSEQLALQIQKVLSNPPDFSGYLTPRLTYYLGKPVRHSGWYPDYQLRLVDKRKAHYPKRKVHERIAVDGKVGQLTGHIEHFGFPTFEEHFRKNADYAQAMAYQMLEEGRHIRYHELLFRPVLAFANKFFFQMGFRDGLNGLLISIMHSYYVFLKYAWLWDLKRIQRLRK